MLICMLAICSSVMAEEAEPAADQPIAAAAEAVDVAPVPAQPALPAAPPMPPPLELRKTGVVSVTQDASGKVAAIKLIVTSYDIILDEGSKALETMNGQKVRVTGIFSMQDGKRCFTVKNVEPMETEEAKNPASALSPTVAPAAEAVVEQPVEAVPAQ